MRIQLTMAMVSLLAVTARAPAVPGQIIHLGTLPGDPSSVGIAINTSGEVVGRSGIQNPFSWSPQQGIRDLSPLIDSVIDANDINDSGHIVGRVQWPNKNWQAFAWTPQGGQINLGSLGGITSEARGVNNSGVVVGQSDSPIGRRAFRWTADGGMQSLGAFGGPYSESNAAGISDNDVIVGTSQGASSGTHAFRWTQRGGLEDLGTLGGEHSYGYGISRNGDYLVGFAHDQAGWNKPFRWTRATGMRQLPTLGGFFGIAHSVNDAGAAVGAASDAAGYHYNVLWTDAMPQPIDLNHWLATVNPAAAEDWDLVALLDINNYGMITGFGAYRPGMVGGTPPLRAFVLDASGIPGAAIPEPVSVSLLLMGAGMLVRRRSGI
jgi:probable HAF family extracellular repeat protein